MKLLRYLVAAIMLTAVIPSEAKVVTKPKGYLFGFIANFSDSVIYLTDIQEVDSIMYDSKNKFLIGRSEYASQLRSYFSEQLNLPHRTCVVSFGLTRKEIEKKYMKIKKLYTQKNAGKYDVRYVNENQFKFSTVQIAAEEGTVAKPVKTKKVKNEKKKEKPDKKKFKEAKKVKNPPQFKPLDPNLPPAEVEMKD